MGFIDGMVTILVGTFAVLLIAVGIDIWLFWTGHNILGGLLAVVLGYACYKLIF